MWHTDEQGSFVSEKTVRCFWTKTGQYIFCPECSTVMKLSSKGICVAVLKNPGLSLEPELPTTQDMALQTASEFSPGGSANDRGSASPLDAAIPHRKKVAPCLVDMSSEQLKLGCSAEIVVSTSALWGDCCAVREKSRHRLWKQRLSLAGRSIPAQLLDPVQYPLHVTHFGHTQVLEEKRKPYFQRKAEGNSFWWPSNSYKLVSQLQREEETKQKNSKPEGYIQSLKPHVKKLLRNAEQAQSNAEEQLQTVSQKHKLLWLSKAARTQRAHRCQVPKLVSKTCRKI